MLEVINQSDYQSWLVNLCDSNGSCGGPLVQGLARWEVVQILYMMMTPSSTTCSQNQFVTDSKMAGTWLSSNSSSHSCVEGYRNVESSDAFFKKLLDWSRSVLKEKLRVAYSD
jgi:hypothetical protein